MTQRKNHSATFKARIARYGAATSDANALLDAYNLNANWSSFVELATIVPVNETALFVAGFRREQLAQDISNTPFVNADARTTLGLSSICTF